jgi:hypothetical protein
MIFKVILAWKDYLYFPQFIEAGNNKNNIVNLKGNVQEALATCAAA